MKNIFTCTLGSRKSRSTSRSALVVVSAPLPFDHASKDGLVCKFDTREIHKHPGSESRLGCFRWLSQGVLGLILIFFFFAGCGSSGGDGQKQNSDQGDGVRLADLAGTYALTSFSRAGEGGGTVDQNSVVNWSGRMVVTSDGRIHFAMTLDTYAYQYVWQVNALEQDALQLQSDACLEWVDMQRQDDSLTFIWPLSECVDDFGWTWNFTKISNSEDLPSSESGDTTTATDSGLPVGQLVGTYALTAFSMTDTSDGYTISQDMYTEWSGEMTLDASGTIRFSHRIGQAEEYNYLWEIITVENNRLQIREDDCVQWINVINSNNGRLILTWPDGECLEGFTATFSFIRTGAAEAAFSDGYGARSGAAFFQNQNKLAEVLDLLME